MALIKGKLDPKRCSETVADHTGFHWVQCSRKAVVFARGLMPEQDKGYCKQHDPEAIKARRVAAEAKWRAKSDRELRPYVLSKHAAKLAAALQGVLDAWKSTTDSPARQNARKALAEYLKDAAE